jgi:hypothetical protein
MEVINFDALYSTRNNLIEEISSINVEEFNRKRDLETWSIGQVCHHLYLAETAFTGAVIYGLKKEDGIKTEQKKFTSVLDRTQKINAPDIVTPGNGPFEVQQILELLSLSRNKLNSLLDTLNDPSRLLDRSTKHPIFGNLALNQWIDLIYLHEQRHIEQIKELKTI